MNCGNKMLKLDMVMTYNTTVCEKKFIEWSIGACV